MTASIPAAFPGTYTDPELALVGLSEDEAKARNIPHEVTTYGLEDLDRAITDRTDFGKVKVITTPEKRQNIRRGNLRSPCWRFAGRIHSGHETRNWA